MLNRRTFGKFAGATALSGLTAPAAVRSGPTASIRPLRTCTSARGSTPAASTVITAPLVIR